MSEVSIHFWDMDHTLVANDCDVSWKKFLIKKGLASEDTEKQIEFFWKQYAAGKLQLDDFFEFQLKEFVGKTEQEVSILAKEHFETDVKATIYPEVYTILRRAQGKNKPLCLITSTNRVIAKPVAAYLGFRYMQATNLEIRDGVFTGSISGNYCGGDGKIPYMQEFCKKFKTKLSECYYYGDSIVDIPIFEQVKYPVVVNPVPRLRELAKERGWEIRHFSHPHPG